MIVPLHTELASGTLRSILRQAGLTVNELRDLLK
ncbi:type II toxin-antitoxin system HicA family toxin [Desulforudis sp. 1031]